MIVEDNLIEIISMIEKRNAEIENLRVELQAEREHADRLAKQLKSWTGDEPEYPDDAAAITAYAEWRKK